MMKVLVANDETSVRDEPVICEVSSQTHKKVAVFNVETIPLAAVID
jgi:hypothetical protein